MQREKNWGCIIFPAITYVLLYLFVSASHGGDDMFGRLHPVWGNIVMAAICNALLVGGTVVAMAIWASFKG